MIIPFFITHAGCPHQCVFCNQKNITGEQSAPEPASLPHQIERYLKTRIANEQAHIAFYGGSFTALPPDLQRSYLEEVRPFLASGRVASIRLSTRPDAITPDILAVLKQYGVATIELGVQSMNDDVLTRSGRGHTSADTRKAFDLIRARGFTIGLQLMPGLPGDTPETFQETVFQIISLKPDFVRIYPALVIKDTPLAELYRIGRYSPLSLDDAVQLCHKAVLQFEQAGIGILRIGLQPTAALERPGTIIAGPWHPAFRQLVESARFLETMRALLPCRSKSGEITFFVNPADLSSAIGQQRRNIHTIRDRDGVNARIIADPAVSKGAVRKDPSCNAAEVGL
jgi:histone acetyltransferase (RNA polymerase elongator complex component)